MGIMTNFQKRKKEDPSYGAVNKDGYAVVGTMPNSAIGKKQAFATMEAEMEKDRQSLKLIQSVKEKERVKKDSLVPKYMPFVDALIAAATAHPILGIILVWLFDIRDIPNAMRVALFCIEHSIPMPEFFKRDLVTYLCGVIVEWAEDEFKAGRSVEPYFSEIYELSTTRDIPDQVRAKILRLKGMIAIDTGNYAEAVTTLESALEFGAKVKTKLAEARDKLEAQNEAQQETPAGN